MSAGRRVLLVAENGEAGGIGRYCLDLAEVLGGQAELACLCPAPCDRTCWLSAEAARRGTAVSQIRMPPRAWMQGRRGLVTAWRGAGGPLVHVNGRRGNFLAVAARLTIPAFRFVTTVHGVLGLHDRRNAVYRVVDAVAGHAARRVIAVSGSTAQRLGRLAPRRRTVVIENGLAPGDLARLLAVAARRRTRPVGRPLRVGFLGRLSPEKGTTELLEVITRGGRDRGYVVVVAGDGPERARLEHDARVAAAGDVVRWLGAVSDVAAFLEGVDVLLMPSHNEGLPYALLEAMAAGCAIVASDVGGIPEVVVNDELGILVPARDVQAIVRALERLAAAPELVRTLGAAASRHVAARYALDDRVDELARAYGWSVSAGQPRDAVTGAGP